MRAESLFPKQVREFLLLAAATGLLAAGCAKVPLVGGKPSISVRLIATANCNNCGKSNGYPLTFRVLQVTDPTLLTGTTLAQVWDHEDKLLGEGLVARNEDVIDPGTRKELKFERNAKAKAVVVEGNFCKTQGSCWYYVKPLKGGGATIQLGVEASCFGEARR